MIKFLRLLVVLAVCVSGSAFADAPSTGPWYYGWSGWNQATDGYSLAHMACGSVPAGSPTGSTMGAYLDDPSGTVYCRIMYQGAIYGNKAVGNWDRVSRCPSKGTAPVNGVCPAMCPPDTNETSMRLNMGVFTTEDAAIASRVGKPIPHSDGTCEVKITGVKSCYTEVGSKNFYCDYTVTKPGQPSNLGPGDAGNTLTGLAFNAPPPTDKRVNMPGAADSTGKCPAGSAAAGVDSGGTTICVGSGTIPTNAPAPLPKTTSAPVSSTDQYGQVTQTTTTTTTNADGSTTVAHTYVKTDAAGGTTVTNDSATGNTPAGQPGKADDPNDKNDLCKRNPNLAICQNSTVSGSCEATACTGDAIQCATLRAAAAMQCQDKKNNIDDANSSPLKTLGSSVAGGSDPLGSSLPTVGNAATVTMPSTLDSSGWLGGGGSFFPDKTITVRGQTITIPFAKYGQYLLVFRYALMIGALLISFRMLSGAIFRE